MKKLLALCLSVCMVLSLVPSVFAENTVPELASAETLVEAEDYGALYAAATQDAEYEALDIASYVREDAKFSGGKAVYFNEGTRAKLYYELKVNAPAAGDYIIEAKTAHNQAYGLKKARFSVNGVETRTIPEDTKDSKWGVFKFKASLTEGENTFKLIGEKAINLAQVWVDYVKFTKVLAPVTVSASSAVKVEAEDYTVDYTLINDTNVTVAYPAEVIDLDTASGGKYIDTTGLQLSESVNAGPYTTLDIPVTVEADGEYIITSDLFWHTASKTIICISEYTLLIDGTEADAYPYPAVTEEGVGNWGTRASKVSLTAGDHTITLRSKVVGRGNKHASLAVDSVEIKPYAPSAPVDIKETGATIIEAEEKGVIYTAKAAGGEYTALESIDEYITNDAQASNGKFVKAKIKSIAASAYYELKVNAPSEGDYKVTVRAKSTHDSSLKNGVIDVNGTETYLLESGTDSNLKVYTVKAHLNKGENTIKYKGDTGLYAFYFYIDYVKVEKATAPKISLTGTTEIEAEDYPYVTLVDKNDVSKSVAQTVSTETTFGENFSGEGFIYANYGSSAVKTVTYELPIVTEKAGIYTVAVGTKQSGTYHATTEVFVNGAKLSGGTSSGGDAPVFEEVSTKVMLNEGENTVKVVGTKNMINAMLVVDYIKVTSAMAVVPADLGVEGITLEAENYPVVYVYNAETASYDWIYANVADNMIRHNTGKEVASSYYELPIEVEKAGDYIVEARVKNKFSSALGSGKLAINGVESAVVNGGTVDDLSAYRIKATFTKGTNTVRFIGTPGSHEQRIWVDYIKVLPYNKATVSATAETLVEAESYTAKIDTLDLPAIVVEDSASSGGAYIQRTFQDGGLLGKVSTITVPVTVEKTGYYNITTKTYTDYSGDVCLKHYSLKVDGATVATYTDATAAGWTENTTRILLNAGEREVTVAASPYATNVGIGLDYIKFAPDLFTVPADLSAEGVKFEAEDNAPYYYAYNAETESYDKLQATVTADGIVKCNAGTGVSTSYYELPIEVSVAGDYIVEARVKNTDLYALDSGKIAVNGVESAVVGQGTDSDLGVYRINATFTKGTNTVRFIGTPGKSAQYVWVDYIKVLPYNKATVSATAETLVEAENYTAKIDTLDLPVAVTEDSTFSGGAYIQRTFQNGGLSGKVSTITVPVTVEKTGYYNITTKTYTDYSGTICLKHYSLKVDGATVATYTDATATGWTETTTRVLLKEGSREVTVAASPHATNVGIGLDYIKFVPDLFTVPAEVPAEGVTFEAEEYPVAYVKAKDAENYEQVDAGVKTGDYSDGKAVAFTKDGAGGAAIDKAAAYYEFTVKAEEAGDYVVEIAATMENAAVLKNVKLSVNGTESGKAILGGVSVVGKYITTVTLTEGINSIKYMGETGANSAGEHIHLVVDYINIKKAADKVAVSDTETVKVEAENYSIDQTLLFDDNSDNVADKEVTSNVLAVLENDAAASGGKYITTHGLQLLDSQLSGPYTTFNIPVTVAKAGRYNVASKLNWIFSGTVCISGYSLYVDGNLVEEYAIPEASEWELLESVVDLSEGDHVITIKSRVISRGNKHAAMAVDYVEFSPAPAENGYVYDSTSADADVTVTTDVAGDVVIALYDVSGKLVGIDVVEGAQATTHERTVACSDVPASCKVFVWNISTVAPLASHIDVPVK